MSRSPLSFTYRLARRKARRNFPLTNRCKTTSAIAKFMPVLFVLATAGVAHAQGTMDFSGAQTLMGTFNWRNDYVGIEQWSRDIRDGRYVYIPRLYEQHVSFAKLWDNNLREQRFLEAFTDKCILG